MDLLPGCMREVALLVSAKAVTKLQLMHPKFVEIIGELVSLAAHSSGEGGSIADFKSAIQLISALAERMEAASDVARLLSGAMFAHDLKDFHPLKIMAELMPQEQLIDGGFLEAFATFLLLPQPRVQEYVATSNFVTSAIGECLANLLLKLPMQVNLVHDILNPHLRCSLSFQILNMLPKEKHGHYARFRMFIAFIDRIYNLSSNNSFLDLLSKSLFNTLLISIMQPQILAWRENVESARTAAQYLTLILENVTNHSLVLCIFHFLFGFQPGLFVQPLVVPFESSVKLEPTPTLQSPSQRMEEAGFRDSSPTRIGKTFSFVQPMSTDPKVLYVGSMERQQSHEVGKYDLAAHRPSELGEFFLAKIGSESDFCSTIILQLIDRLLSFGIREVVSALFVAPLRATFNYQTNSASLRRQTCTELIRLFPTYEPQINTCMQAPRTLRQVCSSAGMICVDEERSRGTCASVTAAMQAGSGPRETLGGGGTFGLVSMRNTMTGTGSKGGNAVGKKEGLEPVETLTPRPGTEECFEDSTDNYVSSLCAGSRGSILTFCWRN